MDPLKFINKSFGVYNIKGIYFEPTYWMAATIVILIFLLVFTFARIRYLYVHWNLGKPSISLLFWGFLLAFIVEGFLILSGRTLFTEVLGWKNAPKPISTIIDIGRNKLSDVLGAEDAASSDSGSKSSSPEGILSSYENLSREDASKVRAAICEP